MTNSFSTNSLLRGAVVLAAVLLLLPGCTKPQPVGTVQGKVTLDAQPFSNARLNFLSKETGTAATAEIQSDGTFTIQAPLKVGTYTVFLAPKTTADPDHPSAATGIDNSVPAKYWNEATSDASVEISEGKNQVTVQLKK